MAITYTAFRGSSTGKISRTQVTRGDLASDEVLVRMESSGVCGTDEHMKHTDVVLGHEGVGIVEEVGKDVFRLKPGDRVGIGYVRGGCGSCTECLLGYSFFCTVSPNNYGGEGSSQHGDTGTWATHAVVSATRLANIPPSISPEVAGPLMCAGQTVWLPLARTDVRPWHTVGVVGLGGLGHLAVQFASRMGCEVIVFSGSDSKRDEAFKLGASAFYTAAQLKKGDVPKHSINHLLVTTSVLPDWTLYEPVLANRSHVFPLTISTEDFKINALSLVVREITIHGICASTMTQVNEMLAFAGRHNIRPMTETFAMSQEGIEEALKKLEAGELRYRAVLKL